MFRAHAPPQGACQNLVCALLTVRETGCADNLVDTIFDISQEQSRLKITNVLRRFVEVDNHGLGEELRGN